MSTRSPIEAIHQEVLTNILNQPLGLPVEHAPTSGAYVPQFPPPSTVADLALPPALLTRITDRIMRAAFQDQFRIVLSQDPTPSQAASSTHTPSSAASVSRAARAPLPPNIKVVQSVVSSTDPIHSWREVRPACRGFRPGLLLSGARVEDPQAQGATEREAAAALWINRRLAFDGLLRTLAHVLALLETHGVVPGTQGTIAALTRAGFPVDLLDFIVPAASPQHESCGPDHALSIIRQIAALVMASGPERADLSGYQFRFRCTSQHFVAATDAGEHDASRLRLQLTRGDHWMGPGSGDNLDLVHALLHHLPGVPVLASIQSHHIEILLDNLPAWNPPGDREITLIAEPLPVSQWARDNAWPGVAFLPDVHPVGHGQAAAQMRQHRAALSPRFASRGDDGSVFVPGENALLRSLPASGIELVHSPLMFQGGNIVLVPDPLDEVLPAQDRRSRLLLIGEAEIARNVALGLTPAEAADALRIEFGAQRAAILPSVSYHLDYELSIRVLSRDSPLGHHVVAFVNDSHAAVRIIIECALNVLETRHILPRSRAKPARQMLRAAKWPELIDLMQGTLLFPNLVKGNNAVVFSSSFARHFSDGPGDNGVGNLYAFLLAFDLMTAWQELPNEAGMMAFGQAVIQGIRRRDADRAALHQQLRDLGFVVVPVPSTADAERGINSINGVHLSDRYLMPTWGGMYGPLDDAAEATFRQTLGPRISIQKIPSAESQRRSGAVHCSTGLWCD
ncbi:MAG: hypothetical protein H7210_11990 [Pyrinomonadaceae bacterium]|nr:hypothetical protein [Phycisphaerales bacterium]